METEGFGYQKPELTKIAEQIYEYKSQKQELELKLSSERFHYKYIPKRKKLAEHEVVFRLLFIIPLTIFVIAAISIVIYYLMNLEVARQDGATGVVFLFSVLALAAGGYADVKLIVREFKMLILLFASKNFTKALKIAEIYDWNTFQDDEENSRKCIEMLEGEISNYEHKIKELEEQQQQILEEKQRREQILRDKEILFDENPNESKKQGKFSLKEDAMGEVDGRELYEFYTKEEMSVNNYLIYLDKKMERVNKEIVQIEEDYETVKRRIIISLTGYVVAAIIQSAFTGWLAIVTNMLCLVIGLIYIFYLERKCKRPVLLYMVEHENSLVQEYAFCNNMVPVRLKREELLEKIEHCKSELADIKKKKEAVIF